MKFKETKLKGAYLIELEKHCDERGFFARSFCMREFHDLGIEFSVVQTNISYNEKKGTLRGMHYQSAPHEEQKIVRCTAGAIYDVIIDLRKGSATENQWQAFELKSTDRTALYIPKGFAHGFQTLCNNVEVEYYMGEYYYPELVCGIRWDDNAFKIGWVQSEGIIISKNDSSYPSYLIQRS